MPQELHSSGADLKGLPEPADGPTQPASVSPDPGHTHNGSARRDSPRHRRRRSTRRTRRVLGFVALGVGGLAVAAVGSGGGYLWSLPGVANAPALADRLVAMHHGTLHSMPPPAKLGDAVVAVEDEHFYSNVFFDVAAGATRAGLATLHTSGDPGGSTIVQQLAKQIYPHPPGLSGTLKEIGLGVKLALRFSKPRLLNMYLNVVDFGNGYWGATAAARGYFRTNPDRLTWSEASLLAGLIQAPSAYDPLEHFDLAKSRQHHVLHQLVTNRYLTKGQARAIFAQPLPLR